MMLYEGEGEKETIRSILQGLGVLDDERTPLIETVQTHCWQNYKAVAKGFRFVYHRVILGDPEDSMKLLPWTHQFIANGKSVFEGLHRDVYTKHLQGCKISSLWRAFENRIPWKFKDLIYFPRVLSYDFKIKFLLSRKGRSDLNLSDKTTLVYFTCRKHFKYLFLSLKSVKILNSDHIGEIVLFIDRYDFLTERQIEMLRELVLPIHIRKTGKLSTWGINLIINELNAFRYLARSMNNDAYIMKVDSDVLFISDSIFKNLKDDCIGDPVESCYTGFKYNIQGGYLLNKKTIQDICKQTVFKEMREIQKNSYLKPFGPCPEDLMINYLVKKTNHNVNFISFQRKVPHINKNMNVKKLRKKYSMLHFSKNKQDMRTFFELYFG